MCPMIHDRWDKIRNLIDFQEILVPAEFWNCTLYVERLHQSFSSAPHPNHHQSHFNPTDI